MRRLLLPACLALVALAAQGCGGTNTKTTDAGPDTSCGLDCVAQSHYGLIANRCFEYTTDATTPSDPPALGLKVLAVTSLEGGVKVLPVEYRVGGQLKMKDSFTLKDGDLYLVRREFIAQGSSVSYRDASGSLVGVKWLGQGSSVGESNPNAVSAYVVGTSGSGTSTDTSYQVTVATPSATELKTYLSKYDSALKLLVGETPDHGSDARRIFVPDVGFTLVASAFNPAGGSPTPVVLQRVRDLGTPDAGSADCSLGAP
jgi:hypothetical protein